MKNRILTTIIFTSFFLNACDIAEQQANGDIPKTDKIAIGTNIKTLAKTEQKVNKSGKSEYQDITWVDLEVPGKGINVILEKFEKEIEATPEGSTKEKEIMKRLQAALNNAPVNTELDKKKIRLSGFISPLEIDEKEGVVKEFLLVPYFGACIHVPPPPLNQTLLIKPAKDQQIKLEDAYEPIWISGVIHAESTTTKLAEAGYKISDVKIEMYTEHLQE